MALSPRNPRHLIARGVVEVYIGEGRVVVTDEHGLIVHIHEARNVSLRQADELEIFGDLTDEIALPN